jgi:hypothetical protein
MESLVEKRTVEDIESQIKLISADGKEIFITQETRKHLLAHPDVLEYLEEAVSKVKIPAGTIRFKEAISLGREIGVSSLVETKPIHPDEETDFAMRIEREYPVRVSLEGQGITSDEVTLKIILNERSQKYFLITAYIGPNTPSNPYYADRTSDEFEKSLDFWCRHALTHDPKIMKKSFKASWNSVLTRVGLLS